MMTSPAAPVKVESFCFTGEGKNPSMLIRAKSLEEAQAIYQEKINNLTNTYE